MRAANGDGNRLCHRLHRWPDHPGERAGLIADFQASLERLIPQHLDYAHNRGQGEGNAHAHLRASLCGCSLTMPFENGELALGTYQQIMLADFDNRHRYRQIWLQIIGGDCLVTYPPNLLPLLREGGVYVREGLRPSLKIYGGEVNKYSVKIG